MMYARCSFFILGLSLGLVFFPGATAVAADQNTEVNPALIKKGRARGQGCLHCHGRYGIRDAAKRAGMESAVSQYTIEALTAFKTGSRTHLVMNAIAQQLSDADIQAISVWLDSIE